MNSEIERLAKEAGPELYNLCLSHRGPLIPDLIKFAALVAEEAAKVANDYVWWADQQYPTAGPDDAPTRIAAAIRAKFALSGEEDEAK